MAKEDVADLLKFMMPYDSDVVRVALWLRDMMWDDYPDTNELIYDNYNAVAFGWSPTDKAGDVFCSIAVYSNFVNFGFNRGVDVDDPQKLLSGDGSLYRYIRVSNISDFPGQLIKPIIHQAYENSKARLKPAKKIFKGETIVKSVSPVKRRPV